MESVLPSEALKQQLEAAHAELQVLRGSLQRAEAGRREAEAAAAGQRGERERFLEAVVEQLRAEAAQRDELLERAKTQLNVLRVRQAKQEDQAEQRSSEELQAVKRKYGNVLKKYHEASTQLAALRRREERANCLVDRRERTVDHSLSLSP